MTEKVSLGKKGSFKVHKGALHRALGVPEDKKIPASKMRAASHSKNPRIRREAASAKGLEAMDHHKRRALHKKVKAGLKAAFPD